MDNYSMLLSIAHQVQSTAVFLGRKQPPCFCFRVSNYENSYGREARGVMDGDIIESADHEAQSSPESDPSSGFAVAVGALFCLDCW